MGWQMAARRARDITRQAVSVWFEGTQFLLVALRVIYLAKPQGRTQFGGAIPLADKIEIFCRVHRCAN